MWIKVIVLSVLAGFALLARGSPNGGFSPRIYEDKIKEMLEDIRLRMCYADPEGLPQLEPFSLEDRIDLNLDNEIGKIDGYIRNLKVEGLSGFIVDFLSFQITLRFNFTIVVPQIVITGEYGLKADLGGFIQLDGEDEFRLELTNVSISASANFVYQSQMFLRNLKILPKIDAAHSAIKNLTPDEEINEFLNGVISEMLPHFNDYLPEETMASLESSVEDLVTGALVGMTASDILGIVSGGGGGLFPPIDDQKKCNITTDDYMDNSIPDMLIL